MTEGYDGRAFVKGAGISIVALLGGLAGGAWWWVATFTFSVEGPDRGMRIDAAWGLGVSAVLVLVAGSGGWRLIRAPGWCLVPVVVVATLLAGAAAYQLGAS